MASVSPFVIEKGIKSTDCDVLMTTDGRILEGVKGEILRPFF